VNKWTARNALIFAWVWTVLAVLFSLVSAASPGMTPLAGIVCLIAIGFWILRYRKRKAEMGGPKATSPTHRVLPGYFLIGSDGYPSTDIEGEFARATAIHKAIGRKPRLDEEIIVERIVANLVPEPTNKYDPNAVMVQIKGELVGYLARDDAARYRPALTEVMTHGYAPATAARIWASARQGRNGVKYVANVRVALNPPHLLVPLNDPPQSPYSLLPWGNSLQVTGEENHQDVLAGYLTPQGESVALGTLAVITGGTARAPKEVIEVRVDDRRVGQLTPGSSQHFIPTVRHLEAQGLSTAAWLRVKGNSVAAQVTVHATKAADLPATWLNAPQTIPRLRDPAAPALGEL